MTNSRKRFKDLNQLEQRSNEKMEMNAKNIRNLTNDIMNMLSTLEEKYDVKINFGNVSYNEDEFHTKLTVMNTKSIKTEEEQFYENCIYYPMIDKDMYRKEFQGRDGKKYLLTGLNTKAKKNYCIIESVENGKSYSCQPIFLGIEVK